MRRGIVLLVEIESVIGLRKRERERESVYILREKKKESKRRRLGPLSRICEGSAVICRQKASYTEFRYWIYLIFNYNRKLSVRKKEAEEKKRSLKNA